MYEVHVLKEGYNIKQGPGKQKSCGSITLLKGPRNIIVDTGNPWDKELILEALRGLSLEPNDIHYVVCTTAHSDKVGNLNLFGRAVGIMAGEISQHQHYFRHGFTELQHDMKRHSVHFLHLLTGLKRHGLSSDRIEYAVCTHGHSDHVGNLNLFSKAIHIVSHDICEGDLYSLHHFEKGIPYEIDDDIEVIATPGHTGSDVSVVVKNTKQGTVAVTGDLFERLEDLEDFSLWQENSENPEIQQQNRMEVLRFADWIVPGHGPMFQVPQEYKSQLRMVMYHEFKSTTMDSADGPVQSYSETNYTVIEED